MKDTVKVSVTLTLILTNQEGRITRATVTKAWGTAAGHVIFSCPFGDQLHCQERVKHRTLYFSKTEK